MGVSPTGKTGKQEYDGGGFFVHNFNVLTGAASASRISEEFIAPFDFKLKEILFNISDTLAATGAIPKLLVDGTPVATQSANSLATGLLDVRAGATTTLRAADYLVRRGARVKFSIPNLASFGGQGIIVGNPI